MMKVIIIINHPSLKPRSWLLHTIQSSSEEMLPHWALLLVEEHSLCHQNRPLSSSKNPHFQNEARCTTFLVKMSFICMRIKEGFHITGWAPTLVWNRSQGELWNGLLESCWEEYVWQCNGGKFWRHNWWKNCWDLVLKWGGFKEQNDPHPSTISFRSAWGVYIWMLGLNGLIDTNKFAQYLHELSRSHWEQNPAWCFSKSLLPSHSLSICATNSIMPVSRMVSLFSPVKNCSHWSDLALQLKVHYSKLIHTRLCKLFQCQDWIENNTRILVCCLKGKSFFTYM